VANLTEFERNVETLRPTGRKEHQHGTSHPHRTPVVARLLVVAMVLTSMSLPWSLGTAMPAHADDPEERDHRGEEQPQLPPPPVSGTPIVRDHRVREDPDARLQIIIKEIRIDHDHDWGTGEFWFMLWLWRVNGGCPPESTSKECTTPLLRSAYIEFVADDTEPYVLNRPIPDSRPGAWVLDASIGPEIGIPVWADQTYGLAIAGNEQDLAVDDEMGSLEIVLAAADNWHIGTWTERGRKREVDSGCDVFPVGCGADSDQAEAVVTYEIRLAPLPDLTPTKIETVSLAGTTNDRVCMDVGNAGPLNAGPFQLVLRIDDTPAPNGILQADELPAGKIATLCTETNLPTSGSHRLSVTVDEARDVLEQRETNNRLEQPYRIVSAADGSNVFSSGGTGVPASSNVVSAAGGGAATEPRPAASPTPGPSTAPSQARPDLTVSAIRVNGQVPDGKGDCKDGKNAVAVVVKNGGTTNADDFAVSLAADKEQVADKRVPGLEAGQAREIRFDDVRLKKGEHKLTAVADAEKTVAESDEGNNGLTVAARCEDD